jgi:hypothetical protein
MSITRPKRPSQNGEYEISDHARKRMFERGFNTECIEAVLTFGRCVFMRSARVFAVGRKESKRFDERVDLESYRGVQVVCSSENNAVLTVYRNRDFSGLRRNS